MNHLTRSFFSFILILASVPFSGMLENPYDPALSEAPNYYNDTNALILDGTGDYLSVAHHPELNPTGEITIEAWVNRDSSSRCETVVGKNFTQSYWLGFCNGAIRFYPHGSGSAVDGITAIPANVWTHIAVTYDGTTRRYYINGELDLESTANPGPLTSSAANLTIGADLNGGLLYAFSGRLDEVRLWNRALTQAEIQTYMYGKTVDDYPEPSSSPGLIAFWPLNRDGGDWSIGGARHTGIPQGNAAFTKSGVEPDFVYFNRSSRGHRVDGICNPEEYADALNYPTGVNNAYVVYGGWDVYICFLGLEKAAGRWASVGLDMDFSRSNPPDSQDYLFTIDIDDARMAQTGNGSGWENFSPPDGYWEAARYSDPANPSTWSAEFRFPGTSFDWYPNYQYGRDHFGIALFEGRSGLPSTSFPGAAVENRLVSWGEGVLSVDYEYGRHCHFTGEVLDEQNGAGIAGVQVQLFQQTSAGDFLLDDAPTDANGAYSFSVSSVQDGLFVLRVKDLGGYTSVSAEAGNNGQVISPNSVMYPATSYYSTIFTARFLDTQGLPEVRTFDKHYLIIYNEPVLVYDLGPLIEMKKSQGYQVEAKDVAAIEDEFSGYDQAEKIRNYLRARWLALSPHPIYALLVGRHDLIPMRQIGWFGDYDHRSPGDPNYSPAYVSDWYYADLDSNWDTDGDHFYGELIYCDPTKFEVPSRYLKGPVGRCPADGSSLREGPYGADPSSADDWRAEISLGRLLVSRRGEVRTALETAARSEASGSLVKQDVLLAGAMWFFRGRSWDATADVYKNGSGPGIQGNWPASGDPPFGIDAADILELSLRPALEPYMDQFTTLYESNSPNNNPLLIPTVHNPSAPLSWANFDSYFANGYGLVNVNGHGNFDGVYHASWTVDRNSNGKIENPVNPAELAACTGNCWELSPDRTFINIDISEPPLPVAPIIFANACSTGAWYKEIWGSTSRIYVANDQAIAGLAPAQGKAAAWIGGLGIIPVSSLNNVQNTFNQDIVIKPLLLGDAFWKGMEAGHSYGPWDWRMHTLMLFGDPAYSYWGNPLDTDAPWPQSGQNWFGSGATRYNGPETGMIKWVVTTNSPASPPVVNRGGRILVGTQNGLTIFNTLGQPVRWVNTGGAVYSSPALGMDGVYFVSGSVLYAYDPELNFRWQATLSGQAYGEPRIGPDGVVWVPTAAGMVRITGAAQPELLSGGAANSPAALTLSGAAVWVSGSSLSGYSMDQRGQVSRGQVTFSGAGILTAPAVAPNGDIYVGASNSSLYKVPGFPFPSSPTQVLDANGGIYARPVVGDDGSVYFGTVLGNLYALNPDGSVRWMHSLTGSIQAAPALDPNRLYVVVSSELRVYEPGSGGLLWSLALGDATSPRSTPVIDATRRLYVTLNNGKLVSVYDGWMISAPENLTASPGAGQMILNWNDTSSNETGFRVEYCLLNEVCQTVTDTPPGTTKVTISPAIYGRAVRFRVKALGAFGGSMAQSFVDEPNYDSEYAYSDITSVPPPAPDAPSGLSAAALSSEAIQVDWSYTGAYSDLLTGFRIYRSATLGGAYSQVGTAGAASSSFVDDGLNPGTSYYYKIAAETAGGVSGLSVGVGAQTRLLTLVAPTALAATQQLDLSVLLTWNDNANNETGYLVERKLPGTGQFVLAAVLPANAETYTDAAALLAEGDIEYRVRAYTATNESTSAWALVDYQILSGYPIFLPLVKR